MLKIKKSEALKLRNLWIEYSNALRILEQNCYVIPSNGNTQYKKVSYAEYARFIGVVSNKLPSKITYSYGIFNMSDKLLDNIPSNAEVEISATELSQLDQLIEYIDMFNQCSNKKLK